MKEAKEKDEKRQRGQGRTFQRGGQWWIAYYGPDLETGRSKEYREAAGSEKAAGKLLTKRIRELEHTRSEHSNSRDHGQSGSQSRNC